MRTSALALLVFGAACDSSSLHAVRTELRSSPERLDFGRVTAGGTRSETVILENRGEVGLSLELGAGELFSIDRARIAIAPMSSAELAVRFHADRVGAFESELVVTGGPVELVVPMRAEARPVPSCALVFEDGPLRFEAPVGSTVLKEAIVENRGAGTCRILAAEIEGGRGHFRVVELLRDFDRPGPPAILTATASLGPGEKHGLFVKYRPLDGAEESARLIAHTDDVDAPVFSAQLSGVVPRGSGCRFHVEEPALELGSVAAGGEARSDVVVVNDSPSDVCRLIAELEPGSDPAFAVLDREVEVYAGAIGFVPVRFAPAQPGRREARIAIRDDQDTRRETIIARGGRDRELCVSPRAIAFDAPSSRAIDLHACGAEPIDVTRLEWSSGTDALAVSSTAALVLSPGEHRSLTVTYRAAAGGAIGAALRIHSNAGARPVIEVSIAAGGALPVAAGRGLLLWGGPEAAVTLYHHALQGPAMRRRLYDVPRGRCAGCHEASPDGRYIAFVEAASNIQAAMLRVIDAETGEPVPVAQPAESPNFLSWRPNVMTDPPYQLVYSSWSGDLHLYSLVRGELGALPGASEPDRFEGQPSWGSNGLIAFSSSALVEPETFHVPGVSDLMIVGEAGGVPVPIAAASDNGYSNFYPQWSPDGTWIAFAQSRLALGSFGTLATDARIYLTRPEDAVARELVRINAVGTRSTLPAWSADGRFLAFSASSGEGTTGIWLAELDPLTGEEAEPRRITDPNELSTWARFQR